MAVSHSDVLVDRAAEPELGILPGVGAGAQIKNQKKPEISTL